MTDDLNPYIGPITMPSRVHHVEANGCQVISATAMPESVIHALVALVDAVSAALRGKDDDEREADRALMRRPCRSHAGQYADYCGPCRSEQIGAS